MRRSSTKGLFSPSCDHGPCGTSLYSTNFQLVTSVSFFAHCGAHELALFGTGLRLHAVSPTQNVVVTMSGFHGKSLSRLGGSSLPTLSERPRSGRVSSDSRSFFAYLLSVSAFTCGF